jgi:hypothetical protein
MSRPMASVYDASRPGAFSARPAAQQIPPRSTAPQTNTISASQARAARRRAARRDEQAVAAWLRELSGRTR